jgi:hypothetical protein
MKRPTKPIDLVQLHLPLVTASKTAISHDKQRELAVALVELLISASQANNERKTSEVEDEPEAQR